jgi:hypothetical protein
MKEPDRPTPKPIHPKASPFIQGLWTAIYMGMTFCFIVGLALIAAILDIIVELCTSWLGVFLGMAGLAATFIYYYLV